MKLKYYLRGIGIGIIVATIILAIGNAIASKNNEILQSNGQTNPTDSVLAYTQEQTTADMQETSTAQKQEETTAQPVTEAPAVEETTQPEETQAETELESVPQPTQPPTQAVVDMGDGQVQVQIGSGSTATQVATLLFNAGIIEDREGFISYMMDNGKTAKLRAGSYVLSKGDSFESLAEQITNK